MYDYNEIIGYEQIKEHLQNAVKLDKVSHAYLINGEKGSGKKLIANTFAKTLQCNQGTEIPCKVCASCKQIESGNQPDVIYVTHEKVSIGIDDIRTQVANDIAIKPYNSKYKIYIIPQADKMTEQAQNALLKTIEEPPSYGIIILLTDNSSRLLPTILSRCVALNLKPIGTKEIKEFLMQKYEIPDYMAALSAQFSQGNVGRAIRYASSDEFVAMKQEILHVLKFIDDMETYEIIEAVKKMSEHKADIKDCIDLMILWFRDVLMFKVTNNPNLLLYKEEYKYIAKQARIRDYESIENIIQAMNKAKIRLDANVNFDLAVELMLLTLKEGQNG